MFKEYETRTSLAMIPFYKERLEFIKSEIEEKGADNLAATKEEIVFLSNTRDDVLRSLEKEKLEVNKMANDMYKKWCEILDLRNEQQYQASNVNLKIYKKVQENGDIDYLFDNTPSMPDEKFRFDGVTSLPGSEISRRKRIKDL